MGQPAERGRGMRFDFMHAMLLADVRFAARSLRRSPAFAATAVLLLTAAIGGITPTDAPVLGGVPALFVAGAAIAAAVPAYRAASVDPRESLSGSF